MPCIGRKKLEPIIPSAIFLGHPQLSSHLLQIVPSTNNPSSAHSISSQHITPPLIPILPLPDRQRDKVINHAPAENPITARAQARKSQARRNLCPKRRLRANKVRHTSVVQKVQTPNASKSLGHDVCEDAAPALGVHRLELGRDVPDLHQAVYPDEDVGGLERLAVPEEHPGADAEVADGVVGDELDDLV